MISGFGGGHTLRQLYDDMNCGDCVRVGGQLSVINLDDVVRDWCVRREKVEVWEHCARLQGTGMSE